MWKKIREFLQKSLTVVLGFGQFREGNKIITAVKDFLTQGVDVVTDVDRVANVLKDKSLTEGERLALAADDIAQILLKHPALEAHKVQDEAAFTLAAEQLAQGFFTLRKSLSADNVQVISKQA